MTRGLDKKTFVIAVNKYRERTANYPWANKAEHEKVVLNEAIRLLRWVFPPIKKEEVLKAAFKLK